jgi:hypothetical protein
MAIPAYPVLESSLLVLGLALRCFHYFRNRSVWHDEAALIINVLEKSFGQLLGPLRFDEAAPPLFLWLIKAISLGLGEEALALRLVPFLASCTAMLLLVPIARRLLAPQAVPWALMLFACSEQLSWHASEAKPYALDVLAAMLLLGIHVLTRRKALAWQLLGYTFLAPFLVFLSYPACFLMGGVLLALLGEVWRARRLGAWLGYLVLAMVTGAAFLALLIGPAQAQHTVRIHSGWTSSMADWQKPWAVPGWAFLSSLEVCRYCFKPVGQPLIFLALLGGAVWWRQGQRREVIFLAAPIELALLAACLQRYPYGGSRVMVFAAPALALLIAAGANVALHYLAARTPLAGLALLILLLMPAAVAIQRVIWLWPEADVASAARFVEERFQPGDLVVGRDWTHLYYFRRLGDAYHWLEGWPVLPGQRLWVVINETVPPMERLQEAKSHAPPNWHPQLCSEASFSTVVLFVAPGP